jgi:RNA polymerase sigma-70 factor (ECF subfamily)
MNMSLDEVYHEFDSNLRKFIQSRVDDRDNAEDILQDVYLKIHNNIDSVRDEDRLISWIYQITRNAIIDQYRRSHPESELKEDLIAHQPEEMDIYAELASSLQGMLNCLPKTYREALELADLQGRKQEDVAKQLGLSLSGAKSRVQRARQKLKQAFLDCCHFEFDHNGKAIDFQPHCDRCADAQSQSDCKNGNCENDSQPLTQETSCS